MIRVSHMASGNLIGIMANSTIKVHTLTENDMVIGNSIGVMVNSPIKVHTLMVNV
jgi:hypothetical protein